MSAQANPVTVSFNNQVPAQEAAKYLGCSYSHLVNLLNKKKLKAQRKEGRWFVETSDLEHAKKTHLISRPRKKPVSLVKNANEAFKPTTLSPAQDHIDIKLSLPREKFELIKMACDNSGKTFIGLINEKLDSVYENVRDKLKSVSL